MHSFCETADTLRVHLDHGGVAPGLSILALLRAINLLDGEWAMAWSRWHRRCRTANRQCLGGYLKPSTGSVGYDTGHPIGSPPCQTTCTNCDAALRSFPPELQARGPARAPTARPGPRLSKLYPQARHQAALVCGVRSADTASAR
eukprot:scaffold176_cov356-Prasinococcus_capsulatus_cf.AAC.12